MTSYYSDTTEKKPVNKGLYSGVQPKGVNAVSGLIRAAQQNAQTPGTQTPAVQKLPGTAQTATAQNLPGLTQKATPQNLGLYAQDTAQPAAQTNKGYYADTAYKSPNTYNDAGLSAEDNALVDQYQKAWQAANAAGDQEMMNYWHEQAEKVRAKYGYSGGDDGYGYIPVTVIDEDGNKQQGIAADDTLSMLQNLYNQELSRSDNYYRLAEEAAAARLGEQTELINSEYDELAKQHYVDRELARRDLPQQMAALGYTGGLAESSLLGLNYDYENNLNATERARTQGLTEQNNLYAEAMREAALQKAEMDSEAAWQYYTFYQQAMEAQRAAELQTQQLEAQSRAEALTLVESMLDADLVPTADMIAAAYGLTPEQAAAYVAQLQTANAPKYYYATNSAETESTPDETLTPTFSDTGMNDGAWREFTQQIRTNLNENNTAVVDALMTQVDGMLSRTQWNELARYLTSMGYVDENGNGVPTY